MGATEDAIVWLKSTFSTQLNAGVRNTPFDKNLVVAIAMQETSYLWRGQYKNRPVGEVLALCVGDTIDAPRRSAFPRNRALLEAEPKGKRMFKVARRALEDIAAINGTYANVARNPDKFCHGFGMFQYDLQFFKEDPDFFLDRKWATFDGTLGKCISELKSKLRTTYGANKSSLTHKESVYVAIAYNAGHANLSKGFKQGFKDDSGKFYGEKIDEFMKLAESTV